MNEPAAEPHYVDYDDFIRHHLDRARSGIRWADILTAAVGLAVFLVGYLLAFAVLDHWVVAGGFGPTARVAMLAAVLAAATGWVAAKVVRPVLRRVNPLYAAHEIERAHPEFAGTLFGLVDAEREDGGRGVRPAIAAALRKRAATGLAAVDPDETVDRRMLMRLSYALLALAVLGSLYALFSPKSLGNAAARAFVPTSATETATRTRIVEVVPGDATLAAGEVLEIECEYADADPKRAVVLFTTDDRRAVGEEVELLRMPDRVKRLAATWAGVSGSGVVGSAEYVVRVGDDEAGPFRLKVLTPPAPEVAAVTLAPPAYTGLPASESSDPAVAGVEGTAVTLSVDCDRPLRTAKVVFADEAEFAEPAEEVTLSAVGGEGEDAETYRYEANWKLEIRPDGSSPAFYRIEAVDEAGVATVRPPVYPIEVRPDLPPVVKIGRPKSPVTAKSRDVISIDWAAAAPDFALRDVILRLEKNGSDVPRVVPLYEGGDQSASGRHRFDLRPLRLRTGDVVTVRPQARDNREPRPNRRIGDPLEIRIDDDPQPEPERPENPPPDRRDEPTERNQDGEQGEGQSGEPGESGGEPGGEGSDGASGEEGGSGEGTSGGPQDGRPGNEGTAGGERFKSPEGSGSPDGAGGDQSAREEPVANDGTQDDDALRELLERDRGKRSEQGAEGERGGEDSGSPEGSGGDDLSGDRGNAPDERQPDAGENGESGNQAAGGSGERETDGDGGGASSDGDGGPTETGEADRPSAGEDRPPGGTTDGGDERPGDPADDRTSNESTEGTETGPARGGTSDETDLPQAPDDLEREGPEGEKRRRPEEGSPPEDGATPEPEAAETGASAGDREGDGATPEGGDETTGRPEDTADASRPDRGGEDGGPSPGQSKTGEPGPPDPSSDSAGGEGEDVAGKSGKQGESGESRSGNSPGESGKSPSGGKGETPDGESPSGQSGEDSGEPAGADSSPGARESADGDARPGDGADESVGQPGGAEGEHGAGEGAPGQGEASAESDAGGPPGDPAGRSGGSQGGGSGTASDGPAASGGDGGTALDDGEAGGEGTAPPPRGVDTSDPDDLRRATDLVLDRLDEDIRRGEVDPELLDRLGWTEDDLKKFAGRMRDRREQATRPGNEAGARAFDELLESVRTSGEIGGTRGTNRTAPDAGGTVGRRPPPPASLAERFEAFSRSVSGERPAE